MKIKPTKSRKRGAAAPNAQLGKTGRPFLAWLAIREDSIRASGDRRQIKELNQKGVPWEPERFYKETGRKKPAHPIETMLGVLTRLESSPGKKGKARHLVKAWDTLGGTGKQRRISHVKLTPTGRETADFERQHGKTPRQVNAAHWRNFERWEELVALRSKKQKMVLELETMVDVMHEEFSYDRDVVAEDEAEIMHVLEQIATLAFLLDEPLTDDEQRAVPLESSWLPSIKLPLAS